MNKDEDAPKEDINQQPVSDLLLTSDFETQVKQTQMVTINHKVHPGPAAAAAAWFHFRPRACDQGPLETCRFLKAKMNTYT